MIKEEETMQFALDRVTDVEAVRKLEPEMEALFSRLPQPNPYLAPQWLFSWWRHYGQSADPVILVVRDATGRLAAYWPF
ncbi:MAG: hypothetical protein VB980_00975, partial [Opitutales bacterium]